MAFGSRMRLQVGELTIELAPLTKEAVAGVAPDMSRHSVTKYLNRQVGQTVEDEQEWYEKVRTSQSEISWGIWVVDGDERTLIGNSTLAQITEKHIRSAVSGSVIYRQEYWGKGIASSLHKARVWYAFQHLGLHRIKSSVVHGNVASRRALEKAGYQMVSVGYNTVFVDGTLRHQDNLECLNPLDMFWQQWWHDRTPKRADLDSRARTREAMDWAEQHVELL